MNELVRREIRKEGLDAAVRCIVEMYGEAGLVKALKPGWSQYRIDGPGGVGLRTIDNFVFAFEGEERYTEGLRTSIQLVIPPVDAHTSASI